MRKVMDHPKTIKDANKIQRTLSEHVKITPLERNIKLIAGVDAAFYSDTVAGSVCLFRYPELVKVKEAVIVQKVSFPYIAGYLAFREAPVLIKAIKKLKVLPDLVLVDGHGIAHPRFIGIASHIGVILDIPTIGCAKSRLIGKYKEPQNEKGAWEYLVRDDQHIGSVIRTRERVKPLFVSPGHLIDIKDSIEIVMNCLTRYRIPEPIRCAHSLCSSVSVPHRE